ncbi:hypothetical protein PC113_g21837 [Phytophthora cactorum]|uniref:RNase H type-1 domain-containing protein n=3 Tax=Phytophthora cactorum TaxID=29920 RepID=A0A8T0XYW1_9STRA|nr:hypothetical protein PC111_g16608 [Phytophthora cactorum]KAG2826020.1 hypothetical protein PC113_g21837 [Phytophthora cactorum]KAG2880160.1 hypothetical protein PC114_g22203 [Phytophthora cactorum]KAG4041916.1 hypothetical protein PC123_g22580 [Phytophthora cactorum]
MIYQRMIDNALWGFVQPKGGWKQYAGRMHEAELQSLAKRRETDEASLEAATNGATIRTKFTAHHEASRAMDPLQELVNSPDADMFSTGEPDESSLVPVLERRSFVDDICFGGETFDSCLVTIDRLLARFEECRISVSFTKSLFIKTKVDFLSYEVSRVGIRADPQNVQAIAALPFPTSKKGMQSFLGALNYYGRFIQDFAVYAAKASFAMLQTKVAEAPILRHFDRSREAHITLFANEWALSATLLQEHESTLHPVLFRGRVLKDAEMNYHPAEKEVFALLLMLKAYFTTLAGKRIKLYTRFSTLEWLTKSKALFGRAVQFAVMLSPWHLVIEKVPEKDVKFVKLLLSTVTSFVDLEDSLAPVAPPSRGSATVRMDPALLYARLPIGYNGVVLSFDGSAKTENHGGYGSCSWILWRLPEWTIVTAASAFLESTTVNIAEYTGMNQGVKATIDNSIDDLIIVGDSRLAIQQSLGVIACRKETLQTQLNHHTELTANLRSVRYLHVVRDYNAAADSLATEALESKTSR